MGRARWGAQHTSTSPHTAALGWFCDGPSSTEAPLAFAAFARQRKSPTVPQRRPGHPGKPPAHGAAAVPGSTSENRLRYGEGARKKPLNCPGLSSYPKVRGSPKAPVGNGRLRAPAGRGRRCFISAPLWNLNPMQVNGDVYGCT